MSDRSDEVEAALYDEKGVLRQRPTLRRIDETHYEFLEPLEAPKGWLLYVLLPADGRMVNVPLDGERP